MNPVKAINIYRKNGDVISIPGSSICREPLIIYNESKVLKISLEFNLKSVKYNWKELKNKDRIEQILKENKDITDFEVEHQKSRICYSVPFKEVRGKNICQFLCCPTEDKRLEKNNYMLTFK